MAEQEQLQTHVSSVLEDPSTQAIARVYANAFLDAADSSDIDGAVEEFSSFLSDVVVAHPDFEKILLSGIINRHEKVELIERVVAPVGSELFTNFLRVLAKHDRLDLLPAILSETQTLHNERSGRQRVQVTSATKLTKATLNKIEKSLKATFSFIPILEPEIDPSLMGGLVIRVENTVYDSSLRTRLKQLRGRLRERSLHEIQSGRDRFSHPEGD